MPLSSVGKAGIGFVSGANEYFVMTRQEAHRRGFPSRVLRHALVTSRQAPGALLTPQDMRRIEGRDERCLLWGGDGISLASVKRYARLGTRLGISSRYKCRQRSPWAPCPAYGLRTPF